MTSIRDITAAALDIIQHTDDDAETDVVTYVDAEPSGGRVLITCFGMDEAQALLQLEHAASRYEGKRKRPIIATSRLSGRDLVRLPYAIELIPEPQDLSALTAAEYRQYVEAKWMHINAKWQPESQVDLGQSLVEFLDDFDMVESD